MTWTNMFQIILAAAGIGSIIIAYIAIKRSIKSDQKIKDNQEALNLLATNDMRHFKEALIEIKDEIKMVWKELNKIKDDNKSESERISRIEGRLNGK